MGVPVREGVSEGVGDGGAAVASEVAVGGGVSEAAGPGCTTVGTSLGRAANVALTRVARSSGTTVGAATGAEHARGRTTATAQATRMDFLRDISPPTGN